MAEHIFVKPRGQWVERQVNYWTAGGDGAGVLPPEEVMGAIEAYRARVASLVPPVPEATARLARIDRMLAASRPSGT